MSPLVEETQNDPYTGRRTKKKTPVFERYQRLMETLGKKSNEKIKEYRNKLFGHNVVDESTELFDHLNIVKAINTPLGEWDTWDVHIQAKYIAHHQLSNMIDILNRHAELQQQAKKNLGKSRT